MIQSISQTEGLVFTPFCGELQNNSCKVKKIENPGLHKTVLEKFHCFERIFPFVIESSFSFQNWILSKIFGLPAYQSFFSSFREIPGETESFSEYLSMFYKIHRILSKCLLSSIIFFESNTSLRFSVL